MKEKKILKQSDKCFAAATVGLATMLFGILPLMGNIPLMFKENKIMEDAGYFDYNEKYKQECLAELSNDYQNGEINLENFMTKSQNIEDYGAEKYMTEYASADAQKEFNKTRDVADVLTNVGTTISSVGTAVAVAGTAAFVITTSKERKLLNKQGSDADKGREV